MRRFWLARRASRNLIAALTPHLREGSKSDASVLSLKPGPVSVGCARTKRKVSTRSAWRFHDPPNLGWQYRRMPKRCQGKKRKMWLAFWEHVYL
jgi:hypothetical protein